MSLTNRSEISGLPLGSSRWNELKHAYGFAKDTPSCLKQLEKGDLSAIPKLYGSINHQQSVYPASFAAVPHLARIASNAASLKLRVDTLCLLGSIHLYREVNELQTIATDLRDWYLEALDPARQFIEASLNDDAEPSAVPYLLSSAAALDGLDHLARVLEALPADEYLVECPQCSQELYVWPEGSGYKVAATDPTFNEGTSFVPVRPPERILDTVAHEHEWIAERCRLRAARPLFERTHAFFGEATCPNCKATFCLFEELEQR